MEQDEQPEDGRSEFLRNNKRFEVDAELESRSLITVGREGHLRCVGP
jgi:hypothetical protein